MLCRPLRTREELREASELQCAVWGFEPLDALPWSQLLVWEKNGGVVLGAFVGKELVGLSIAHPAWDGKSRPVLYSKMLGVHPRFRGAGIGRRLKLLQRQHALRLGYRSILWTFDPLVRASAVLNIGRLGAEPVLYEPNFYGEGGIGGIHGGLSSDRFLVRWQIGSARVRGVLRRRAIPFLREGAETPWLVSRGRNGSGPRLVRGGNRARGTKLVALPSDIDALKSMAPGDAAAWRRVYRRAFVPALAAGASVDVCLVAGVQSEDLAYTLRGSRRA